MKILIPLLLLIFTVSTKANTIADSANFFDIRKYYTDYYSHSPITKGSGWKQFKRWEYFWGQRTFADGKFPDNKKIIESVNNFRDKNRKNNLQSSLKADWKLIGPKNSPENHLYYDAYGIGRVNIVRFAPDGSVWIGSASGGLWKSTDKGKTWNVIDFSQFLSIGVSDIAFSEANPQVIYVATGDADGSFMSHGYSIGIIKSTDGGNSWAVTGQSFTLDQNTLVARLLVSRTNPNLVIAGTSTGIHVSSDGGNTWTRTLVSGIVRDMEFSTNDQSRIIAATVSGTDSYIQVSTNYGNTWKSVKTVTGACRIALAVTPLDAKYVYAVAAKRSSNGLQAVLQSTDGGDTWLTKCTSPNILANDPDGADPRGQGNYDLAIAVNANDKKWVYVGGVNVWQSKNEASSFSRITHWQGYNEPFVHADIHDLQYDADDNLYCTNDGGITSSTDHGKTWNELNNTLSITEVYRFSSSAQNPNIIYTGNQDNGSFVNNGTKWSLVYGGDGMDNAVDPNNSNIGYVSLYYGSFFKTTNGANNFDNILDYRITGVDGAWITPFILNPKKSSTLYAGYNDIWKSDDYGANWYKLTNLKLNDLMSILAVAPSDTNYIYAANSNTLRYSTNGGSQWTTIMNAGLTITGVAIDPTIPNRAWITCSGYTKSTKVWEWDGKSLKDITYNLPALPVNCIVYQKNTSDRIFIGTDIGIFYKDRNSNSWMEFNEGLPNVVIMDLEINYANGKLRAGTFGRGIWESSIYQCNIDKTVLKLTGNTSFCQGDSLIIEIVSPKYNYKWSNNSTATKIKITESGDYFVMATDTNGCSDISDVITVNSYPYNDMIVSSIGSRTILCDVDSITLSASFGFAKYKWSSGDTLRKIVIKKPGTYTVSGTSSFGCVSNSKPITIVQVPKPAAPQVNRDKNMLVAIGTAAHYQWYLNGTKQTSDTNSSIALMASGFYKVEITDTNGCKAVSDSIQIVVDVKEILNNSAFKVSYFQGSVIIESRIEQAQNIGIEIYTLLGNRLYSTVEAIDSGLFLKNIKFVSQPDGMYVISISAGATKIFTKFIKN
ncbi:MAG: T9SS type A sorting domain-containing protein [Candidatus Kapabacteria bacterium]|nr:T9SS type A sorting domain-containing protein [Candidatus Kapabacteria bacterium]